MPANQLGLELLSIGGVPDSSMLAALVGDAVSFAPQQTFAAPTVTLTRKPAGSAASVSSNSITFDVAGYYTVTVAAGGFTRTITVVCFPTAVTSVPVGSGKVGRTHLAGLILDPRLTLANITATLEAATPTWIGIFGSGVPVLFGAYAN
jgi:hypothetical protein